MIRLLIFSLRTCYLVKNISKLVLFIVVIFVGSIISELENVILLHRREKTGATNGYVSITALYTKTNEYKETKFENMVRISTLEEFKCADRVYISIKRSQELKYKPGVKKGTNYKRNQQSLELKISKYEETIVSLKSKLSTAKKQIKSLNKKSIASITQKLANFQLDSNSSCKKRLHQDNKFVLNAFEQN